jgi:hypothetical protein
VPGRVALQPHSVRNWFRYRERDSTKQGQEKLQFSIQLHSTPSANKAILRIILVDARITPEVRPVFALFTLDLIGVIVALGILDAAMAEHRAWRIRVRFRTTGIRGSVRGIVMRRYGALFGRVEVFRVCWGGRRPRIFGR